MKTLKGKRIILRALEPEDLDFLFQMENNEDFWMVSNTQVPFSKYLLKSYIEQSHLDIYQVKQLRLVVEDRNTDTTVGMIDLFDFDPANKRAGVGVLIHPSEQQKGYASEALELLIQYSFKYLGLHQLYANITADNVSSINLFQKHQFSKVGVKKDWIYHNDSYKDEILYQRFHE